MSRQIDADKLKKHYAWWRETENGRKMADIFDEIVDAQPTADVVEVVRCKECVHHTNAPKTTDVWCERVDGLLPKDWFCADGETGGTDV